MHAHTQTTYESEMIPKKEMEKGKGIKKLSEKHHLPCSASLRQNPNLSLQFFDGTFLINNAGIPKTTWFLYRL